MTVVHPITRAWISTGGTGARNYDEFADDAEITAVIQDNPDSALAIEMPHRAPGSLGKDFASALPDALRRLARQRADGTYAPAEKVIALYRIGEPGRPDEASYGIWAMVDTDQISTSADEPGVVIRNEDVFLEKVRERIALAKATGYLLSPVLLLQTGQTGLRDAVRAAVESAGPPVVTDIDHTGRTHALWPVATEPALTDLVALAGAGELIVADGNHRTLAAQLGGLRRFLAVITTVESVRIQPYHRLVAESPVGLDVALDRLRELGARVHRLGPQAPGDATPGRPEQGSVHLYGRGESYQIGLPAAGDGGDIVTGLDHTRVEQLLLRDALGLEPGDKRITYVGGDYPPEWLVGEVDAGRADLAILIAPVRVDDFVRVNLAREKMPRKSTWFTPKARAGLVLAEIAAEG